MTGGAGRARAETAGAALALLLLAAAAFWPVVSGTRTFFHLDLYYEHLPVWQAAQRALLSGQSPFWLDGEYCGHPALFIQEAPLFYPPMAPMLLTGAPVHRLADLFSLAHLWLAGLLAFVFVREVCGDPLAALFSGVAWMLSARMVESVLWPNAVAASALLPAVLWAIVRIGRGRRRSGVVGLAAGLGLALLTARPHVLLAAAPVVAAVAAAAVLAARPRRRAAADLLLGGALALAVGAPALAPSLALYPETSRAGGLTKEERDYGRLSPGTLAPLVRPVDGRRTWPESASYPGVLAGALFLAGLGLAATRRRPGGGDGVSPRGVFLALAAGGFVGLVFAFGEAGPYGLFARLPVIRGFRVPVRYLLSWALALASGAGLVLSALTAGRRRGRAAAVAAIAILSLDLVIQARRTVPTAPAAVYSVRPASVDALAARLGVDETGFPRRYASYAETIYPTLYADADMLLMLREFEPLQTALGMRFGLESSGGYGPTLARTEERLHSPGQRPLELAGVGGVLVSGPRREGAPPDEARPVRVDDFRGLPRAILVPAAVVAPPDRAWEVTLDPRLDPRRIAVLEEGEPIPPAPTWRPESASARRVSAGAGRLVLDATLPARGVLVVFNTWEAGWRATVDGAPARVERGDGAFQAVRLPAGTHRVAFAYRPRGLVEGLGLGLAGILATVLAGLRLRPV